MEGSARTVTEKVFQDILYNLFCHINGETIWSDFVNEKQNKAFSTESMNMYVYDFTLG